MLVPVLLLVAGLAAAAFPLYLVLVAEEPRTDVLDASAVAPTSTSSAPSSSADATVTTEPPTTTEPPLPELVPCSGNLVMIGDSLTSVSGSSLELVRALIDAGCDYDLVGSTTDAYGNAIPVGRPMIAQGGFNSCGIDGVLYQKRATLEQDPPDLALIRVGLNNFFVPGSADERNPDVSDEPLEAYTRCVTRMIARLRDLNPDVTVVLAKPHNELALELDPAIDRLGRDITRDNSPVIVTNRITRVDTDGSLDDGGDIVHPTAEGAAWLGLRESGYLVPYLRD
ncbi:MAG: SGNH/GDSL hydrolase family protein [Actinomycetota bacterium]|nr:SGNH/GDSL hydrolase family protein [Actinomycetota bacterium]